MPGRIVDNKDSKNESLSLEKDSTMTIHPCEINSALFIDAQLGCHDNEALILDTFNNAIEISYHIFTQFLFEIEA